MDTQVKYNSDIQMQLDVCTGWDEGRKAAEKGLEVTCSWLERAANQWRKKRDKGYKGALFPIVQGNFFEERKVQNLSAIIFQICQALQLVVFL